MTVADVVEWIARPGAELALTGTAAVVASVGTLVVDGVALPVGTPGTSPAPTSCAPPSSPSRPAAPAFAW